MTSAAAEAAEIIASRAGDRGRTVAVAESLTGGRLGATLAAAPDAARWYRGAVTAYCPEVKHTVLSVPDVDPVSETCARAMATAVCALLGADLAVAVTGEAGPEPAGAAAVGTVWCAVCDGGVVDSWRLELGGEPQPSPERIVARTVERVLVEVAGRMSSGAAGPGGSASQ